jgi:hypothetical protein
MERCESNQKNNSDAPRNAEFPRINFELLRTCLLRRLCESRELCVQCGLCPFQKHRGEPGAGHGTYRAFRVFRVLSVDGRTDREKMQKSYYHREITYRYTFTFTQGKTHLIHINTMAGTARAVCLETGTITAPR